ncbi:hypothetical protein JHW43_005563 [Diplocarpon mali]|nr:hypothetical protein JHW43_005563 [Diplocarpon mali]
MVTWPERISGLEDAARGPSSPAGRCRGHGRPDILEPRRGPGLLCGAWRLEGRVYLAGLYMCLCAPAQGSVGPPVQYTAVAHSTVQQHRTTPHRPPFHDPVGPTTHQPAHQLSSSSAAAAAAAIPGRGFLLLPRHRLAAGSNFSPAHRGGTSGPGSRGSSRARGPRAGPGAALPRSRPRLIATTTLEPTLERPMDSASTRGEIEKEADAVRWGPGAGRRDRVRLPGWRGGLGRRGEGRGGGCLGICYDGAGRLDGRAGLYIEGWSTSVALQMRRPESGLEMS